MLGSSCLGFSYTANVYRDLQVLYREIRVRGFQIYGDEIACYPQSLQKSAAK